ncbi:Protein SnodProt1 [Trichoderma ghanense]|uniref:Protein SnodProt1 n=1 Tax=Trichoderma ghanense TaxID=65468 RepID=A0ABY2HF16_9HYPO
MHLSGLFQVAALVGSAAAETMSATFNTLYEDPSRSLSEVTCWRKNIGFMPNLDWTLQQDAAGFIGLDKINGLNSGKCFTCWRLSYEGRAISLLALDGTDSGVVMSFRALQYLTDGRAQELGRVEIDAVEADTSECGVPATKLHAYDF